MPTSKKRGGKKTHNKRVNNRKIELNNKQKIYEKKREEFLEQLVKQHEDSEKMSQNIDVSGDDNGIDGIDAPMI